MPIKASKFRRLLIGITSAAVLTFSIHTLDTSASRKRDGERYLAFARQVSTQVETLSLMARELGEASPTSWAIRILGQGVEPRAYHLAEIPAESADPTETTAYDSKAGVFKYVRPAGLDSSSRLSVKIPVTYVGFLGTRTPLASDLATVMFFALSSLLICLILTRSQAPAEISVDSQFRDTVVHWISEAKFTLTALGSHIRDMVREAKRLTITTVEARNVSFNLHEQIKQSGTAATQSGEGLAQAETLLAQAEKMALNAVIESARFGDDGKPLGRIAEELHKIIQKCRESTHSNRELVAQVEQDLLVWSEQSRQALEAFESVFRASDDMGKYIRTTSESLLDQAKLIQKLKASQEDPPKAA